MDVVEEESRHKVIRIPPFRHLLLGFPIILHGIVLSSS